MFRNTVIKVQNRNPFCLDDHMGLTPELDRLAWLVMPRAGSVDIVK
jgi:hypothetical protein